MSRRRKSRKKRQASTPPSPSQPPVQIAIHAEDGIVQSIDRLDRFEGGTIECIDDGDCCGPQSVESVTFITPIYRRPPSCQ